MQSFEFAWDHQANCASLWTAPAKSLCWTGDESRFYPACSLPAALQRICMIDNGLMDTTTWTWGFYFSTGWSERSKKGPAGFRDVHTTPRQGKSLSRQTSQLWLTKTDWTGVWKKSWHRLLLFWLLFRWWLWLIGSMEGVAVVLCFQAAQRRVSVQHTMKHSCWSMWQKTQRN